METSDMDDNRIIFDDPFEKYNKRELKKRKKNVWKWDDKTFPKKEKRHNKTRDIEREDEI